MYNGFMTGYPYLQFPAQQPVQPPAQQAPQGMSPPTIHADIVQIEDEREAWNRPVTPGTSQMMITRDESAIYIKSAYANSQPTMDVYLKSSIRPREGPSDYVTREEVTRMLEELRGGNKPGKKEASE